jgi:hypothetical protein
LGTPKNTRPASAFHPKSVHDEPRGDAVAFDSLDALDWLRKQLEQDNPDPLPEMVKSFAERLMSAAADVVCGAGYGERSAERVNSRKGYLELAEVVLAAHSACGFSEHLSAAIGSKGRSSAMLTRLYAAIPAQATNLGPEAMARASGLSYDQLRPCSQDG